MYLIGWEQGGSMVQGAQKLNPSKKSSFPPRELKNR